MCNKGASSKEILDYISDESEKQAKQFDENPRYKMSGIRFFHGSGTETAYDDFGTSTLEGLYQQLTSNPKTRAQMQALWEEV